MTQEQLLVSGQPANAEEGLKWLHSRLDDLKYPSISAFAKQVGINKGNLYRYFTHESKPAVSQLPRLCKALEASAAEVLWALGVSLAD